MKNKLYEKKIFRLLYMLNKLGGAGSFRIGDVAKELKVTVRSIQRDIALLSSVGFPLFNENGRYKFVEGFSLKKISVTPSESFLINLFFELFSKTGDPFNLTAKMLMNKLLLMPEMNGDDESIDARKQKILQKEIKAFSLVIGSKLKERTFPKAFRKKIDLLLDEIEIKIKKLGKKEKMRIDLNRADEYVQNEPVAYIDVPQVYFKDPDQGLYFLPDEENRLFTVKCILPDKYFPCFRISLGSKMLYKVWGAHLEAKDVTCFDKFAAYLGFTNREKHFSYETAYGTSNSHTKILITSASISWEEKISKHVIDKLMKGAK